MLRVDRLTRGTIREWEDALEMRTTEAMLHQSEIERLDRLKERLGLSSRSDATRVVLAKADLDSFTPDDAAALHSAGFLAEVTPFEPLAPTAAASAALRGSWRQRCDATWRRSPDR